MRKIQIAIIIILIMLAPVTALAGKPTPGPYPAPGAEAQAYPPPEATLPAYTPTPGPTPTAQPVIAWPDPRPGFPYAWGYLDGRWLVTLDGAGLSPDLEGVQCLRNLTSGVIRCYPLRWVRWDGGIDRNYWYMTGYPCLTGGWEVFSVFVLRYGDVRQPNVYSLACRQFLPIWQQG